MGVDAYISHRSAGRVRLRVPERKRDDWYFSSLREGLLKEEGVDDVEVNPLTGSVLVTGRGAEEAVSSLSSQGLVVLRQEDIQGKTTTLHEGVAEGFAGLDRQIKAFTGNAVDLSGLAFVALVAAGLYQIGKGNFAAPAWYTAFWYALGIFGKSAGQHAKGHAE